VSRRLCVCSPENSTKRTGLQADRAFSGNTTGAQDLEVHTTHATGRVARGCGRLLRLVGDDGLGSDVFPVFAIFGTGNIWLYALAMLVVFGVIHALFYGAQGTLYASLFPARIRYTGLSTVYQ
jgi:hypothetical protein